MFAQLVCSFNPSGIFGLNSSSNAHKENDNQFQKREYNRSLIEQQIDKANRQEREELLKEKKKDTATTIPLLLKYNRKLPKTKYIVMKHWHLLLINLNQAEIFQNPQF